MNLTFEKSFSATKPLDLCIALHGYVKNAKNKKMKSELAKPVIQNYTNYRLYLKKMYEWRKSKDKKFSYEYCSKKLKTSKSYLKQVFDEKNHTDLNRLTKISQLFKLDPFDRQYLIVLVIENQLTDTDLKKHFVGILEKMILNENINVLKKYRKKVNTHLVSSHDWLSQTIGALTKFDDFEPEEKWISQKLLGFVTKEDIKKTLLTLINNKTIQVVNGRYQEMTEYDSPDPFDRQSYKNYLHGVLKTLEILEGDFESHRPGVFFSGALSFSTADYSKVTEIFYKCVQDLIELSEKTKKPDSVIYVSKNLFHVAKANKT